MSFRPYAVGDRLLTIRGGSSQPIYFVTQVDAGSEDLDRGIVGSPVDQEIELKPRPVLSKVNGATITRQAAVLQLGDYQLQVPGRLVTEDQLRDVTARIKNGVELFRVISYEPRYIEQGVCYYVVYVRGLISGNS